MKYKLNKILLRVVMVLVALTLVTSMLVSTVFAKYITTDKLEGVSGRPAAFEFEVLGDHLSGVYSNLAQDGAPGAPIGYTEAEDHYMFTIESAKSEVGIKFEITITFAREIYALIAQARSNRYQDGLWCDYKVYQGVKTNGKVTKWTDITGELPNGFGRRSSETLNPDGSLTWTYTIDVAPHQNPDGTTSGKAYYKLEIIPYNSTLMDEQNYEEYFYSSDSIEINVTGTQREVA